MREFENKRLEDAKREREINRLEEERLNSLIPDFRFSSYEEFIGRVDREIILFEPIFKQAIRTLEWVDSYSIDDWYEYICYNDLIKDLTKIFDLEHDTSMASAVMHTRDDTKINDERYLLLFLYKLFFKIQTELFIHTDKYFNEISDYMQMKQKIIEHFDSLIESLLELYDSKMQHSFCSLEYEDTRSSITESTEFDKRVGHSNFEIIENFRVFKENIDLFQSDLNNFLNQIRWCDKIIKNEDEEYEKFLLNFRPTLEVVHLPSTVGLAAAEAEIETTFSQLKLVSTPETEIETTFSQLKLVSTPETEVDINK